MSLFTRWGTSAEPSSAKLNWQCGRGRDSVCSSATKRRRIALALLPIIISNTQRLPGRIPSAVVLMQLSPPYVATTAPTPLRFFNAVLAGAAFEVSDNLSNGLLLSRFEFTPPTFCVSYVRLAYHSCLCNAHLSGHAGVSSFFKDKDPATQLRESPMRTGPTDFGRWPSLLLEDTAW